MEGVRYLYFSATVENKLNGLYEKRFRRGSGAKF